MNVDELDIGGGRLRRESTGATRVVVRTSARILWLAVALVLLAIVAGTVAAARGTGYTYGPMGRQGMTIPEGGGGEAPNAKSVKKLLSRRKQLEAALQAKLPKGIYVVVDQTQNRIYLKKDEETILNAACSAGSGMVLKEGDWGKGRKWVFDTPRGLFKVKSRQENPVWKKPDWAFVEEGKPIPKNDDDRMDYGTLGEYSFQLGDGYMIHGTLYERLLGRSVTHGCIRVGRDDLRKIWKMVPVGTPVYIY